MDHPIAYCGLNCEKCEARLATVNNDNTLRELVAKKWSAMNQVTITAEMINCLGCKGGDVQCYYCSHMCEIRKCAIANHYNNCGECNQMNSCTKLAPFIAHTPEIINNLKK